MSGQALVKEQGEPTVNIHAPQAGAPLNRIFPEDEEIQEAVPGWSDAARQAAIEARAARLAYGGVDPATAHAQAHQYVTTAITRGLQTPALTTHNHLHSHVKGHPAHTVVHRHAHSHVKGARHPHPSQHHHSHKTTAPAATPVVSAMKMMEKFSWLAPFQIISEGVKRLLKGVAITVGKTKNRSAYTQDELLRAARTLENKPLLLNHLETPQQAAAYLQGRYLRPDGTPITNPDGSPKTFDPSLIPEPVKNTIQSMVQRQNTDIGQIIQSEYEDDGVEYVAAVTDPAAIQVVDKGLVKGPSIGAIPRNQDLKDPRGIVFEDMSLITAPETPGDPDATAKVMEKLMEMLREPTDDFNLIDVIEAQQGVVLREMLVRIRLEGSGNLLSGGFGC